MYASKIYFISRKRPGVILEMTDATAKELLKPHASPSDEIWDRVKEIVRSGQLGVHYDAKNIKTQGYQKFLAAIDAAPQ